MNGSESRFLLINFNYIIFAILFQYFSCIIKIINFYIIMLEHYNLEVLNRKKFILIMLWLCILNFFLIIPFTSNVPPFITLPIHIIVLSLAILSMILRYHDIGKSGLWILLIIIPIAGPVIVIIQLTFFKSKKENNKYLKEHDYLKVN